MKSIKLGIFYKGITNKVEKRIKQHEGGQSNTTKKMLPVKLVHVEVCSTREEARKLEKFFKSGYGRELLRELFG